ncbi:MAG: DUF5989 family protein [Armatimonadota bacterium]|nr:DUF5989 family protein [Armatimonadota bacterium]
MIAFRGIAGTLGELFRFLWKQKLWWLIPMIVVLLVLAVVIILGAATPLGSFIYSFF